MLQFPFRLLGWHQQIASIMMFARRLEIKVIMLTCCIRTFGTLLILLVCIEVKVSMLYKLYCTKVAFKIPTTFYQNLHVSIIGYIPSHIDCHSCRSVLCVWWSCAKPWYLTMSHHNVIQGLVSQTWVRWAIACSNGVRDTQKIPEIPLFSLGTSHRIL